MVKVSFYLAFRCLRQLFKLCCLIRDYWHGAVNCLNKSKKTKIYLHFGKFLVYECVCVFFQCFLLSIFIWNKCIPSGKTSFPFRIHLELVFGMSLKVIKQTKQQQLKLTHMLINREDEEEEKEVAEVEVAKDHILYKIYWAMLFFHICRCRSATKLT